MTAAFPLALALCLGAIFCTNAEHTYHLVHLQKPDPAAVKSLQDVIPTPLIQVPEVEGAKAPSGQGRIIDGSLAGQNQFPHQVALLTDKGTFCGGSIISPRWVLTAEHCIPKDGTWIQVHACGNNWRNSGVQAYVTRAFLHPDRDIAVLDLGQDLPISDCLKTIDLEPQGCDSNVLDNVLGVVSGHGGRGEVSPWVQDELWHVYTQVISNDECRRTFGGIITTEHLCTKALNNGNGVLCGGDSGGPLLWTQTGRQIGVNNFVSAAGCESGAPSGYARVPCFIDWIRYIQTL